MIDMKFHLRLDEEQKTPEQIAQREATYQAAKILNAAGYKCEVNEYYTGKSKTANAASIILEGFV